jgi:hypothetical protein
MEQRLTGITADNLRHLVAGTLHDGCRRLTRDEVARAYPGCAISAEYGQPRTKVDDPQATRWRSGVADHIAQRNVA